MALALPVIIKDQQGKPLIQRLTIPSEFSINLDIASLKDYLPTFTASNPKEGSAPTSEEDTSATETENNGEANANNAWIAWSDDQSLNQQPNQKQPQSPTQQLFYRWKDADGTWQFSLTPNPDFDNQIVAVDPQQNLIQALKIEEEITEETGDDIAAKTNMPLPTTIPVKEIPDLIDKAKDLQALADERLEQLKGL